MMLMLGTLAAFLVIGLSSPRFGRLQGALVFIVVVALVLIQFSFPRFL